MFLLTCEATNSGTWSGGMSMLKVSPDLFIISPALSRPIVSVKTLRTFARNLGTLGFSESVSSFMCLTASSKNLSGSAVSDASMGPVKKHVDQLFVYIFQENAAVC